MEVDRGGHTALSRWSVMLVWGSVCLSGCGIGTAVVGSSVNSGGSDSTPTEVGNVEVSNANQSPARVRFDLIDPDNGDVADVRIMVVGPSGVSTDATLEGNANLSQLATSPSGERHERLWDFAADLGGALTRDVKVEVLLTNGNRSTAEGLDIGNDPPELEILPVAPDPNTGDIGTNIDVEFMIADTSDVEISVDVDFRRVQPNGVVGPWFSATPVVPLTTLPPSTTPHKFVWDSVEDLPGEETEVELRLRATDSAEAETERNVVFTVDNDAPPTAFLNADVVVGSSDVTGGVPIPFAVDDPEDGRVNVLFQWKYVDEPDYEPKPSNPEEAEAWKADPFLARERRVCTEVPLPWSCTVGPPPPQVPPTDSCASTLPASVARQAIELRGLPARLIQQRGIATGDTLEILRPNRRPLPATHAWEADIERPVGAVQTGDAFVVLDHDGTGWRLREIEPARGGLSREIARGEGSPDALVLDESEERALVAHTDSTRTWFVSSVDLETGDTRIVASSSDAVPPVEVGPVQGMLSLGSASALLSLESTVVRIDYGPPAPRVSVLLRDLVRPAGLARHPSEPTLIYVVERGPADQPCDEPDALRPFVEIRRREAPAAGRVSTFDLRTHERTPFVVRTSDGQIVCRPGAISVDLLAKAMFLDAESPRTGERALYLIVLGGPTRGIAYQISTSASRPNSVYVADDLTLLVTLPEENEIAIGGGVLERTNVLGFASCQPTVLWVEPFPNGELPPIGSFARLLTRARSVEEDTRNFFVWDARDVVERRDAQLRMLVYDGDLGVTVGEFVAAKALEESLFGAPTILAEAPFQDVSFIDVNLDGVRDLVCSFQGTALVLGRDEETIFSVGGEGIVYGTPRIVDIDRDGLRDVVVRHRNARRFEIFRQRGGGFGFGSEPDATLPTAFPDWGPHGDYQLADFDGDGWMDLLHSGWSTLEIHLHTARERTPYRDEADVVLRAPNSGLDLDERTDRIDRRPIARATTAEGGPTGVRTLPALAAPFDLGDIDADGRLDLVATSYDASGAATLRPYLQQPDGTFRVGGVLSVLGMTPDVGLPPDDFQLVDVDDDGRLDIVSICGGVVGVARGTKDGFDDGVEIEANADPAASNVGVADMNSDGRTDLLVRTNTGTTVLLRDEWPTFRPLVIPGTPVGSTGNLVAVDLDEDGAPDILDEGAQLVLHQSRDGNPRPFEPPVFLQGPGASVAHFDVADVDGDGLLDVGSVWYPSGSSDLSVIGYHRQTNSRQFDENPAQQLPTGGSFATTQRFADLNGDGEQDAVVGSIRTTPAVVVGLRLYYEIDGHAPEPDQSIQLPAAPTAVEVGDMNLDGQLDLIVGGVATGVSNLRIYSQLPQGGFIPFPSETVANVGTSLDEIVLADLNDDGYLSVLAGMADEVTVLDRVAGDYHPRPPLPAIGSLDVADLDGDGSLDLLGIDPLDGSVVLFYQDTNGDLVFGQKVRDVRSERPFDATWAIARDTDKNGLFELIVGNRGEANVLVFNQLGAREYLDEGAVLMEGVTGLENALFGDLDLDGQPDLLAGDETIELHLGP